MAYNLAGVITLKDKSFTSTIKQSTAQVKGLNNQMRYATNQVKRFEKAVASGMSNMAKKLIGFGAAYMSIRGVIGAGKDLIESANKQIEAETRLQNMMMNVKGTTLSQVKAMQAYASELQGVGVVGDEVGMMGMAQLATFNLQADSIKTLSKGMYDLAVNQYGVNVTGEQMQGIANVIGKAMEGNAGALTRYGVTMTEVEKRQLKYGNQAQRAAIIAKVLQKNVGGINEAMANTPEGAITQLKNIWGDMKEALGYKLLPKVVEFAHWFKDKIPAIQETASKGIDMLMQSMERLGQGIDFVKQNSNWLIPVLSGVVGAIAAFKIISTVQNMMKTWQVVTKGMTIAQLALNLAMSANPIGLVAAGIGLVIAAGVALWKNWDKIKQKAEELWEKVSGIWRKIKSIFGGEVDADVKMSAMPYVSDTGLPAFANGINRVPRDMMAVIHKDEAVIPAEYNPYNPNAKNTGKALSVVVNINGYNKSTREIINEFVPQLKLALANM